MAASSGKHPLHVMQVVHSLQVGGSERLACDLAQKLDPSLVRSSVCAMDVGGPLGDELTAAGVPFHVMGREPRFDWRLIPRLHRLFRDTHAGVVQTHHLTQLIYAGLGARLAGARVVHVEHEAFSLATARRKHLLRLLGGLCHRIVAVGEDIGCFLTGPVGLPTSLVTVIRNGVDLTRYSPVPRVTRRALGLPVSGRLIGHVGRLDPLKDQACLLRAFRLVAAAHPDTRLILVGDGAARGSLEHLAETLEIRDRVLLLGSRPDVPDLLPHFEIFALSSIAEGLPLSVLEAMACARPVVATAVGELPIVVREGSTGAIVPPRRPDALAAALTALLDSPARGAAFGRAARALVEQHFTLESTVQGYQAIYQSLPAYSRGPRHSPPRAPAAAGTSER